MILLFLVGGIFVMLAIFMGAALISELLGMAGFVIAGIVAILYGLFTLFVGGSRMIERSNASAPDYDPKAIYVNGQIIGRDLPADRLSRADRPIFGEIK